MFKILTNVGQWDELYVAPSADSSLREFLPHERPDMARSVSITREGVFFVDCLAFFQHGDRPRMVLLVYSDSRGFEIGNRLLVTVGEALRSFVRSATAADAKDQRQEIEKCCAQIQQVYDRERRETKGQQAREVSGGEARSSAWKPAIVAAIVAVVCVVAALFVERMLDGTNVQIELERKVKQCTAQQAANTDSIKNLADKTEATNKSIVAQLTDQVSKANAATKAQLTGQIQVLDNDVQTLWASWGDDSKWNQGKGGVGLGVRNGNKPALNQ
jgi:hypothetical protein